MRARALPEPILPSNSIPGSSTCSTTRYPSTSTTRAAATERCARALARHFPLSHETETGSHFPRRVCTSPNAPQACHALEVPLIFNATGPLSLDASSERIRSRVAPLAADRCVVTLCFSAAMMKMWGDFAKTGQPTPAGDAWPAWNSVQQSVMNINQVFLNLKPKPKTASNCDFNKDSLTLSSDAGGTCDKLWNKWTVFWDVPAV